MDPRFVTGKINLFGQNFSEIEEGSGQLSQIWSDLRWNDPHKVRVSEKRKQNKVKDTSILPIVNN